MDIDGSVQYSHALYHGRQLFIKLKWQKSGSSAFYTNYNICLGCLLNQLSFVHQGQILNAEILSLSCKNSLAKCLTAYLFPYKLWPGKMRIFSFSRYLALDFLPIRFLLHLVEILCKSFATFQSWSQKYPKHQMMYALTQQK